MKATTKQEFKLALSTLLMSLGFALVDSLWGLFLLRRMLEGAPVFKTLRLILGFSERILALGAISLYAFRFVKGNRLPVYISLYALLGLNTGILLFAVRGAVLTAFMVSQHRLVFFDFFTLGQGLVLSAACVVICTSVGLIRRAADTHRQLVERKEPHEVTTKPGIRA